MKRLYSPWRDTYIATFKKKGKRSCLFCQIARGKNDEKNLVVMRTTRCFAVMNLYPYNSGHVMVVPYRHTSRFESLTAEEYEEIMRMTAKLKKGLDALSGPHGYNFGANLGRVAGAGIDKHIHFHLVPRWSGDTNFMPVLGETKLISEDLKKTWRRLRKSVGSR